MDYTISNFLSQSLTTPSTDDSATISPSISCCSSDDSSCFDPYALLVYAEKITSLDEDILLKNHGYTKAGDVIHQTSQDGEIVLAHHGEKLVAIKKIAKDSTAQQEYDDDESGFTFITDQNVVTEISILKAIHQQPDKNNKFIVQYIDSFESDDYYYLVTEYIEESITLKEYVTKAHQYIRNSQLKLKDYKKSITKILYQLATTLHSLHYTHRCCHLNVSPENVLLQQSDFIQKSDKSMGINPNIQIKLVSFGLSEQFEADNELFESNKQLLNIANEQYLCPDIENINYDSRGIDMWALGITMYYAYVGAYPYQRMEFANDAIPIPKTGTGFWAVMNGKIARHLAVSNKSQFVNSTVTSLLCKLLNVNSSKRLTSAKLLNHKLFCNSKRVTIHSNY